MKTNHRLKAKLHLLTSNNKPVNGTNKEKTPSLELQTELVAETSYSWASNWSVQMPTSNIIELFLGHHEQQDTPNNVCCAASPLRLNVLTTLVRMRTAMSPLHSLHTTLTWIQDNKVSPLKMRQQIKITDVSGLHLFSVDECQNYLIMQPQTLFLIFPTSFLRISTFPRFFMSSACLSFLFIIRVVQTRRWRLSIIAPWRVWSPNSKTQIK